MLPDGSVETNVLLGIYGNSHHKPTSQSLSESQKEQMNWTIKISTHSDIGISCISYCCGDGITHLFSFLKFWED